MADLQRNIPVSDNLIYGIGLHTCSSGLFGDELPEAWRNKSWLRRRYAMIRLGYYLVGDEGKIRDLKFPGSTLLRKLTQAVLYAITGAPVPGWYDTHARLARIQTRRPGP